VVKRKQKIETSAKNNIHTAAIWVKSPVKKDQIWQRFIARTFLFHDPLFKKKLFIS